MCTLSANCAFDKATNGQTDIKHEMCEILSLMSLLQIVHTLTNATRVVEQTYACKTISALV